MKIKPYDRFLMLQEYYGESKIDAMYSMSLHIRDWIRKSDEVAYPEKEKIEWLNHFKGFKNPKRYLRQLFLFHKLRNMGDAKFTNVDNKAYNTRTELIRFLYNNF